MNTSKKLYRSRTNRMFGGVAGGLAEYFNVDVSIVRLAMLFLILGTKGGLILYIILCIVLPEAETECCASENIEYNPEYADYV